MVRFLAYGPAALWAVVVLYLGSRPHLSVPRFFIPFDKAGHFAMYAILGGLAAFGWRRTGVPRVWLVPLLAVFCVGAADELHQRVVPNRSSDVFDWVADATGASCAFVLVTRALRNDSRSA
jgi:VanZ family protein